MRVEDVGPALAVLSASAGEYRKQFDHHRNRLVTLLKNVSPAFDDPWPGSWHDEQQPFEDKDKLAEFGESFSKLQRSYQSLCVALRQMRALEGLVLNAAREGKAELSAPGGGANA
jgi:hypothetical protein